jgi:hypothetical protein
MRYYNTRATVASNRQMMLCVAHGAPCIIVLPHCTWPAAWYHLVKSKPLPTAAAKKAAKAIASKDEVTKEVTAVAAVKKATKEYASKAEEAEKAAEEAATKRATEGVAMEKATEESVDSGSSPTPEVGMKGAAPKWFRGAWRPRYVE